MLHNFTREKLLDIYRIMALSRRLDEKQLILLKQGRGFFHIGASGHESAQVGAALNFKAGKDWFYPYYRDQAFVLTLGNTVREIFMGFLGKADCPATGGRQMPQHYGHPDLRIVTQSSPTGTQFLQAVGSAFAAQRENRQEIVYVSAGEGTTSQGDFHEALNWASREKAPVIFHIENNGYAISVPIEDQTSGASVFNITAGFDSLERYEIDGTDFFAAFDAFEDAVTRARNGMGPSIVISNVIRLLPHSSSDDHRKYRSDEELEADRERDPLIVLARKCIEGKLAEPEDFDRIQQEVTKLVDREADNALEFADPSPDSALENVYYNGNEPYLGSEPEPEKLISEKTVMVDAINHALDEELARNDKMVIYGEDVAGGKGGVFTATKNLTAKYGADRVFNSPLAESSILGTAFGMAASGFKPVVEIQFGDYIWTAMMQLRDEIATLRYRSNNHWSCPTVIRVPVGGYIHGGLYHSQNIEGFFAHLPGVLIAYPSNAADAKGLLKWAIRNEDPVLFLEHKGLYRQGYAARPEPDEDYVLPFGKANVVQEGSEITIVTYGMMVQKSVEAVRRVGVSAEIIDIRTINPLDIPTIMESISKTNRVLIVHEDMKTGGFGAEISARIMSEGFELLDAPIKRVASKDSHIPFAPALENAVLVQTDWIVDAVTELVKY